jgi:hypothetical protein
VDAHHVGDVGQLPHHDPPSPPVRTVRLAKPRM